MKNTCCLCGLSMDEFPGDGVHTFEDSQVAHAIVESRPVLPAATMRLCEERRLAAGKGDT